MKRNLLCLAICISPFIGISQAQIENPGFEGAWEDVDGSEDEPEEWSSLKTADALTAAAPVVAFQETTDPHSGTYCLRLENAEPFPGIVANGIVTNGRLHAELDPDNGNAYTDADAANPQWHYEFSDKPDSLVCWIKYAPEGGDQGKIEVLLHTNADDGVLPAGASIDHWVGKARIDFTEAESEWTRMAVPFSYYNSDTPDYLLCVISAGDSTIAVDGSQLWIDDIELIYNDDPGPGSVVENDQLKLNVFAVNNYVRIETNKLENSVLSVSSLDGKVIYENTLTEFNSEHYIDAPSGIYLYSITYGNEIRSGKIKL
ncbi:MAG: T9SS type A sorting domain-containing protein [Flavobacteriales bacterium]|nr:T9SS type A sorting domain-containing protein [Flavobacteriales bacterium]